MEIQYLTNLISGLALTVPRIAAAFLMLPMLTEDSMPPLVRNSFFVSLGIVAFPYAAAAQPLETVAMALWLGIVLKEILIGLCIGFLFGIVFWAIGNVGNIIDTKAGTTLAMVIDPIQGHQTSLTGAFLSRLASWLFMTGGGFLVFLDLLFSSYSIWPVTSGFPTLRAPGQWLFIDSFARMMLWSLLLAGPALIILALVDMGLGLINRFAQQLNVIALSLSIKAWMSVWIVLLCLGVFIEFMVRHIADSGKLVETLSRAMS